MKPSEPIRVLFVEDNPATTLLITSTMKNIYPPIDLVHTDRLDEAIQCYAQQRFDAILLDLNLPDIQGIETVRQAKTAMSSAPIVVLTGNDDAELGLRCVQEGVQDFLVKDRMNGSALRRVILYAIERKRLEETKYRQIQKMESLGRLAGGIAHDFNNLLSMMSGYATFLRDSLDPQDARRSDAEEIRHAVDRASALTRQLLSFSRNRPLQPSMLDLNAVVNGMDKMIRRLISENIELRLVLEQASCGIRADAGQIEQVLLNLVVNARDAMPNGGVLTIETHALEVSPATDVGQANPKPGRYVMLKVTDTGCGMNPETLKHVFEPFFTTKKQGAGTGIGLATVYDIVRQFNGHMMVESEPDKGAVFTIYFPFVVYQAAVTPPAASAISLSGKEVILFVEDEPVIRAVARRTLESYGYGLLEATNGLDALKVVEEHPGPIDLLVTDIVMPGMGGIELAKQLTSIRPNLKVIFLSGYKADADIEHHWKNRPTIFLPKPFGPPELAKKVRATLDLAVR